jgi:hypothetical protein
VEIELGYFNLERTRRENTITTPSAVLNYGFAKNWEAVGEFRVQASPDFEITDPGLSVKGVLKEGVLQDKQGVSVAVEAGLLLPSTFPHVHGVGFEAIGIVSGKLTPVTVHINGGGGLDRDDRHAFAVWGVIGELPVHPRLRLVARSTARARKASDRTTRHCSAPSGSRRRRACFSMLESGAVSVARRRTGSSLLV